MSNSNAEHSADQEHQASINPGGNRNFGPSNSNVTSRLLQQCSSRSSRCGHIQNAARMVVLNDVAMRDSNSRSILVNLHWLPIRRRIEYKIFTLVHKCLSSGVP